MCQVLNSFKGLMERMIELHASFCFMKFYLHYFVYPPGNRKTFLGMFEKFP